MVPLNAIILVIVLFCSLAGIIDIVKARRKKQKIHYFFSGFSFLVIVAVVVFFFGQLLLSLVLFGVLGLMGIFLLPESFKLHRKEIIIQKQETDVSAPLAARDFLNWNAWIKLKAIYGFRKMITIYLVSTTSIVIAILFVFILLGIIPLGTNMYSVIMAAAIPVLVNYYQSWKILKEDSNK